MLILVNRQTGEIRPAPTADTIGPHQAHKDEVLIDSAHQVYKHETGEVVEVPPWTPTEPVDYLPARLSALETRLAQLETALSSAATPAPEACERHSPLPRGGQYQSPPPPFPDRSASF